MTQATLSLKGSIPALITPMQDNGSV
ncbi:MAG: hypothetical protein RL364_331, partial [Pseudomonadota bacterium]